MCKRKTTAEYTAQVAALSSGITVVGEYKTAKVKITHECAEGHQWDAAPYNILRGKGCPRCSGRIPPKPYQERLDDMGKGFTAIGEYKDDRTNITHECAEGHQWDAKPNSILRGRGCPHCSGRIPAKPYQERLDDMGKGFTAIGEYKTVNSKITHECDKGHQWEARPSNILGGDGCPHCSGRIPAKTYQERLDDMGKGITAVGEYKSAHTNITHECAEGHQWEARPSNMLSGNGCPVCAEYGFNEGKPSLLYVLEHKLQDGRTRTNIGITNRTVEERYAAEDLATVTRRTTISGLGADVRKLEQRLHEMLSDHLDDRGFGFRTKKGSKECFDYPFEAAAKLAHYKGSPEGLEVSRAVFN